MSDPPTDSTVVYQTTFVAVGDQVPGFVDAGILVFFAAGSPAELHDICVLHEAAIEVSGPRAGDTIRIGEIAFPVLACGHVVETHSTVPTIHVEICSDCHPFFTGKQKFVDAAGRVEKFRRRYGIKSKNENA